MSRSSSDFGSVHESIRVGSASDYCVSREMLEATLQHEVQKDRTDQISLSGTAPSENSKVTRGKNPDRSWTLRKQHWQGYNLKKWLQIVVATAYSEARGNLLKELTDWLDRSDQAVRLALAVFIDTDNVKISAWVPGTSAGTQAHIGDIVAEHVQGKLRVKDGSARAAAPFKDVQAESVELGLPVSESGSESPPNYTTKHDSEIIHEQVRSGGEEGDSKPRDNESK
ncbi:hypothetical protein KEM56_001372 [Ascosphaera pollenicola]|nr:hypothetical protein KEM56_001372 [Ascosphaera pollenicola]